MDDAIWRQDKENILEARNKILSVADTIKEKFGFHAQNRLIYVFQKNVVKNKSDKPYVQWFEFAQKTLKDNNKESDFQSYLNNLIFSRMIQRLCTQGMKPDELRRMIGETAYAAAKQLYFDDLEKEEKYKLYSAYHQVFGSEVMAEKLDFYRQLTAAHQEIGKFERATAKIEQEIVRVEQEKARIEQEKLQAEQLVMDTKTLLEAEKLTRKLALKEIREKAKEEKKQFLKDQKLLLKAEKEKQEQLLKAEKEKQEQLLKAEKEKLLKAEKEKQEQLMLELGKKMLDNGQDIAIICNLLNISEAQLNQYCAKQSKI
jgi:hypothetical protein